PNRPDRPELQWLVVSGQRRRFTYFRGESGLDMAPPLPGVQESSPQYWDDRQADFASQFRANRVY
ncbi:MAG: hypothetical protein OXH93_07110, partial [Caldilineaceae bacterium]|nr:hypothetical protein [Caldilineaceae bacterium]